MTFCLTFLFSFATWAQDPIPRLHVESVLGDRVVWYRVSEVRAGVFQVETGKNIGDRKVLTLTPENAAYLQSQADKISERTNEVRHCARDHIKVITDKGLKVGCWRSKTTTAQKARDLLQLFQLLF